MGTLTTQTNTTNKFILQELPEAIRTDSATILTDGSRSEVLKQYTLMGKIAASEKWKPYDNTATDGSAVVAGIYIGEDIAAATIAAADVTGQSILLFGAKCDTGKLVFENSVTLASVVTGAALTFDAGTGDATATLANTFSKTVGDILMDRSLFFMTTGQIHDTY